MHRRKQKAILALQNIHGQWVFERNQIGGEIMRQFNQMFTSSNSLDFFFYIIITNEDNIEL